MDTPVFLNFEQVLRLHDSLIETYGGIRGVRDKGLLQSAIAMPQVAAEGMYLHEDIFSMAAAYLFHIVKNHAFLDGNKRTGAAAAIVFLAINNIQIKNDENGLVELTMEVARGSSSKPLIASFFSHRALAIG